MAYYFDNQEELDRDIEQRVRKVEAIRFARENSKLSGRLKQVD